jgi:hypothetical protein
MQIEKAYKKLLTLYPRSFRERFGESMEQTYRDLCNEWAQNTPVRFGFLLRIFVDTGIGALREHMSQITQKISIRSAVTNPWSAAIISLALCLPFVVSALPLSDVKLVADPVRAVLTLDGQQLSMFGRVVVFGGVLLLPVALFLNLVPMFTIAGPERKISFSPRPVNLTIMLAVLFPVLIIARWIAFEAVNCSKGICD